MLNVCPRELVDEPIIDTDHHGLDITPNKLCVEGKKDTGYAKLSKGYRIVNDESLRVAVQFRINSANSMLSERF